MSVDVAALLSGWRDAFREASLSHDIVPLGVELLNDTLTPVGAFERFVGHSPGFLFESVEDGQRFGRFSFLGRNALGTCTSGAGE
jgi:anthranilate synthase component 1